VLVIVAAWALFAFAGAYRWTVVPILAGAVVLAAVARPTPFRRPDTLLDFALLMCLLTAAAQLVPLSPSVRHTLSPSAETVERALFLNPGGAGPTPSPRPLSLDPASTVWALATGVALLLIFWSARRIFARGGALRFVTRWIGWLGLALAIVMFVQRALTPGLIYGFWHPITRASHPTPLGPFVNRNDLATWLMMGAPLTFGYTLAHLESRRPSSVAFVAAEALSDPRLWWLGASLCLMTAALLASLSRSGIFGGAAAVLTFALLARRRLARLRFGGMLLAITAVVVFAAMYANVSALMERISYTVPSDLGGRLTVWRETWPMARDFPWTGIGVGAFEHGMIIYQQSTRLIFFNHAHNEYLQVLVEGGAVLAALAAVASLAAVWGAASKLRADRTPVFWMRAGAASAVAAVAAQSLWDTGLRMPPNAVLFAIAAAIALHEPEEALDPVISNRVAR
jgi:O-antigen ligase